jgi:hypothetical protein
MVFLFWLVCFSVFGKDVAAIAATDAFLHSIDEHRQIQYSFSIQNMRNTLLSTAEMWCHAPVKETSFQHCLRLESSEPNELVLDNLGNQILHFTFSNFPPLATKIITIKSDPELSNKSRPVEVERLKIFLQPEQNIESDHLQIVQLARRLKGPDQLNTVQNIFKWVSDNIKYVGYLRNTRGALYALRNKKGDCTEFMCLFVALCRANGIPARGIGGYTCSVNCILKPGGYHNWAEFYYNGAWRITDPQRKLFMKDENQYIAMKVIRASAENPMGELNRYRFVGDGLKITMN